MTFESEASSAISQASQNGERRSRSGKPRNLPGGESRPPTAPADSSGPDECPVQVLGHFAGTYYFIDTAGQFRAFRSRDLFQKGSLPDLFGGNLDWCVRNYP